MAKMMKCDFCNELYEYSHVDFARSRNVNGIVLIDKDFADKYYARKCFDLCPNCIEKIKNLIKNKKAEEDV